MQQFTKLRVWQRAHALVLTVYELSKEFPTDERYGLTSQIRRAAVSVPCNIVEGAKRSSPPEYQRFLNIAEASLAEVQYLLILVRDLRYDTAGMVPSLLDASRLVARMLHNLRSRVRAVG